MKPSKTIVSNNKLTLGSSKKPLTGIKKYSILIYGENGAGKTYFAGTWPKPLFIVPEIGLKEMVTLEENDFPVVSFRDMDNCIEQIKVIAQMISRNEPIGSYVPRTIVFDNITTTQLMVEKDLNLNAKTHNLDFDGWAQLKNFFSEVMVILYKLPCHVIWITHSKIQTIKIKDDTGRLTEENLGTYTLRGSVKEFIPGNADHIFYMEKLDRGLKGEAYFLYGQKRGIWNARMRGNRSVDGKPFTKLENPSYDGLAPYLGLPSLEEEEKA